MSVKTTAYQSVIALLQLRINMSYHFTPAHYTVPIDDILPNLNELGHYWTVKLYLGDDGDYYGKTLDLRRPTSEQFELLYSQILSGMEQHKLYLVLEASVGNIKLCIGPDDVDAHGEGLPENSKFGFYMTSEITRDEIYQMLSHGIFDRGDTKYVLSVRYSPCV